MSNFKHGCTEKETEAHLLLRATDVEKTEKNHPDFFLHNLLDGSISSNILLYAGERCPCC